MWYILTMKYGSSIMYLIHLTIKFILIQTDYLKWFQYEKQQLYGCHITRRLHVWTFNYRQYPAYKNELLLHLVLLSILIIYLLPLCPLKNMTQTIVSSYHVQSEKSIKNLRITIQSRKSKLKEIIHEALLYFLYVVCVIIVTMLTHLRKTF